MMRRRTGQKGFTLIETLLAVMLFMIVSISAYSVFAMGIQIWKRAGNFSKGDRRVLLALERMQEDVQNTLRYEEKSDLLFTGDKKEFKYYGKSDGFLLPAAVQIAAEEGTAFQVGAAGYRWNSAEKKLCRQTQNLSQLYKDEQPACIAAAEGVEYFRMEYWIASSISGSFSWYDEWNGRDALPQAMRLTLRTRAPKSRVEKNYVKTFLIPVADQPVMETKALS